MPKMEGVIFWNIDELDWTASLTEDRTAHDHRSCFSTVYNDEQKAGKRGR
jgi:hypothetical protein